MQKQRMEPVDLSQGGESWKGWKFGQWGRAREWRLHAPDGALYTAGELHGLHALQLDVDFLRLQVRELTEQRDGAAVHLTLTEVAALLAAAAILARVLPADRRRHVTPRIRDVTRRSLKMTAQDAPSATG